jgi:hypothetical protein
MKTLIRNSLLIFVAAFIINGCSTVPVTVDNVKQEDTRVSPPIDNVNSGNCALVSETLNLQNQTVKLPTNGRMPLESHLLTKEDGLPWPKSQTDRIAAHLSKSCTLLKAKLPGVDCNKVYSSKYAREWTPSEGGYIGQGSGAIPPLEHEMFSGNLYWTSKNKPRVGVNDKFLVCANSKCVVITMAYETGPGNPKLLGGIQPEIQYLLGANNDTQITLGRLKNQATNLGPVVCK